MIIKVSTVSTDKGGKVYWLLHAVFRSIFKFHVTRRSRASTQLRISWVFSVYIADFWQTFWVIWENGSNWSNLRLNMSFFALGRLKNHKIPHLHPNHIMCMPLIRHQLNTYVKLNFLFQMRTFEWIKICCNFTLQTQISTRKYTSWLLRLYSAGCL